MKNNYKEEDLVLFTASKGINYKNDLMVIGRAVNDWDNRLSKNEVNGLSEIMDKIEYDLLNRSHTWVEDDWGINSEDYQPQRSAFWRVSRKLSVVLSGNTIDPANSIVYSNLYKFAKKGGGNPSEKLAQAQYEECKLILEAEIDLYKPKFIVFLTGRNWAKEFLDFMNHVDLNEIKRAHVSLYGKYKSANFVVADHPQGKDETLLVKEVLDLLKII
jgi:hypothetical protein